MTKSEVRDNAELAIVTLRGKAFSLVEPLNDRQVVRQDNLCQLVSETLAAVFGAGTMKSSSSIANDIPALELPRVYLGSKIGRGRGHLAYDVSIIQTKAAEILACGLRAKVSNQTIRDALLGTTIPAAAPAKAKPAPSTPKLSVAPMLQTPTNVVPIKAAPVDDAGDHQDSIRSQILRVFPDAVGYVGPLVVMVADAVGSQVTMRGRSGCVSREIFFAKGMPLLLNPHKHIEARDKQAGYSAGTPLPSGYPIVTNQGVQWVPLHAILVNASHTSQEVENLRSELDTLKLKHAQTLDFIHVMTDGKGQLPAA